MSIQISKININNNFTIQPSGNVLHFLQNDDIIIEISSEIE